MSCSRFPLNNRFLFVVSLSLANIVTATAQECVEVRHSTRLNVAVHGGIIRNHGVLQSNAQCLLHCANDQVCVACYYEFTKPQCTTYATAPAIQAVVPADQHWAISQSAFYWGVQCVRTRTGQLPFASTPLVYDSKHLLGNNPTNQNVGYSPNQNFGYSPNQNFGYSPNQNFGYSPNQNFGNSPNQNFGNQRRFHYLSNPNRNFKGSASDQFTTRIIGGTEVEPHSFPWQVAIKYWRRNEWLYICGGSLMSNQVVLTAAHCFDSPNPNQLASFTIISVKHPEFNQKFEQSFKIEGIPIYRPDPNVRNPFYYQVLVGAHNVQITESTQQARRVTHLSIHENYPGQDPSAPQFDFAMMRMHETVTLDYTAQPIPLANVDVREGTFCRVTGWGLTEYGKVSALLLEMTVPILPFRICNDQRHYNGHLNKATHICASARDKDSCKGDSGGPFICWDSPTARWYQHGVVSFGHPDCNREEEPGVYARITAARSWILNHRSSGGNSSFSSAQVIVNDLNADAALLSTENGPPPIY